MDEKEHRSRIDRLNQKQNGKEKYNSNSLIKKIETGFKNHWKLWSLVITLLVAIVSLGVFDLTSDHENPQDQREALQQKQKVEERKQAEKQKQIELENKQKEKENKEEKERKQAEQVKKEKERQEKAEKESIKKAQEQMANLTKSESKNQGASQSVVANDPSKQGSVVQPATSAPQPQVVVKKIYVPINQGTNGGNSSSSSNSVPTVSQGVNPNDDSNQNPQQTNTNNNYTNVNEHTF